MKKILINSNVLFLTFFCSTLLQADVIKNIHVFNDVESFKAKQISNSKDANNETIGGTYTNKIKLNDVCLTAKVLKYKGKNFQKLFLEIEQDLCSNKFPMNLTNYESGSRCWSHKKYYVPGIAPILSMVKSYNINIKTGPEIWDIKTLHFYCDDENFKFGE